MMALGRGAPALVIVEIHSRLVSVTRRCGPLALKFLCTPTSHALSSQMALVVDELAAKTPGKRSLAMAAFARALRALPTIICDNAGVWRVI